MLHRAISTRGLTKHFGNVRALENLTLEIPQGEVFGLLGPNGAGKTTMIRLLLGLLKPTRGDAQLFGKSAWGDVQEVHGGIAYVPGEFRVWPQLTGLEMLELLASTRRSIDFEYQQSLIDRFDFDPSKRGRSYSKGNRQKVVLISALASRAPLLILDEPTSGLDPLMEEVFQACIREAQSQGQTVLLSSHILSEVEEACDRVGILRNGELVECGTIASLAHLHSNVVEISWTGEAPSLNEVAGVTQLERKSSQARFHFDGEYPQLLRALDRCEIQSFRSTQPTLEELFLTLYEQPESASGLSS